MKEALCVLTSDPYEIVVMAPNASLLKSTLQQMSERCEFRILTNDSGPLFTKHRLGQKISADLKVVLARWNEKEMKYIPDKQTACELILIGHNKSLIQCDSRGSVYEVVPSHLILEDKECVELTAGRMSIENARYAVGGRSNYIRFYLELQDTSEKFDLENRPLLCYRHWVQRDNSTHIQQFMTDFALLEISPKTSSAFLDSLSRLEHDTSRPDASRTIKKIMTEHREFHHLDSSWISISIEKIFPRFGVKDLDEMYRRKVRVECKGMIGHMHRVIYRQIGTGRKYTQHITFIREEKG